MRNDISPTIVGGKCRPVLVIDTTLIHMAADCLTIRQLDRRASFIFNSDKPTVHFQQLKLYFSSMKALILFLTATFVFQASWADTAISLAEAPITNFHSFGNNLYRGARPLEKGMNYLQQIGVKNVIDLQGGDLSHSSFPWVIEQAEPGETAQWISFEKSKMQSLGINFSNVPLSALDPISKPDAQNIAQILQFISDPQNQPVFVHCEHGKDRTGLVIALYRVFYENWSPQDAHDEMVEMGHGLLSMIVTHNMDEFFWKATQGR